MVPAAVAKLVVSDQPTGNVTAGSTFELKLVSQDKFNNNVTDFQGTVDLTLKTNVGSDLRGTISMSAANGVADFAGLSLETAAKGYIVTASSVDLTSATTGPFDVVPAAAALLAVTSQPMGSVTAGNPIGVTVVAEDRFGNIATQFQGPITAALLSDPGGPLGGTLSVNAISGVARFSDLNLTRAANGYSIMTSSAGLSSAATATFDVIAAAPRSLAFSSIPLSITASKPFSLAVSAEDSFGNVATTASGTITISLVKKPKGGKLVGRNAAAVSAGIATFSALKFKKKGKGFQIRASGLGLAPATSKIFNVTVARKKRK